MAFELPDLPYADNALEPHYSANTFSFHHKKHHNAYVTKANELVAGTDLDKASVEEAIAEAHKAGNQGLFNQVAQIWNHTFFWNSMSPNGGGEAKGDIADAIKADFGSTAELAEKFKASAVGNFGSGWTWVVLNGSKLEIVNTSNAGTPLTDGLKPILTVDVWEHAYYLDYQNRRPDFVQAFWDHLVNWDFANANMKG
ncbi:MAG: superoxide dismutase [Minwuia sp.]|uniref:superoxide dismutase n=1 Tax=Minwuia sp. TaxID=2493630 RepID=UPI003A8AA85E